MFACKSRLRKEYKKTTINLKTELSSVGLAIGNQWCNQERTRMMLITDSNFQEKLFNKSHCDRMEKDS